MAAGGRCDPEMTLGAHYTQDACATGDFPACDELHKYFYGSPLDRGEAQKRMRANHSSRATAKKPSVAAPFQPGEFVKYRGRDGRETVGEIQGTTQPSPTSGPRLMATNPLRGTMEVREDPRKIKKIDRNEYEKIAGNQLLEAVGFKEGANIICDIGGVAVDAVLEEVSGSVFDEGKEHVFVKVGGVLKKIPLDAVKKATLKRVGGTNVARAMAILGRFTKVGALLNRVAGGPGAAAFFTVMAPTAVACAELVALLYTNLEPNCENSSGTTLTDYFKTLNFEEQNKLVRGSSNICEALQDYLKKKVPQGPVVDFSYNHLECSSTSVAFRSQTSLFPQVLIPGHSGGYEYQVTSPPNSKKSTIIAKPYTHCRYADVCIGGENKESIRIETNGSEVSWISVNGQFITATTNPSVYKALTEQIYSLDRQSHKLRNECVRQKGETLPTKDVIQ